ncbi:MAG: CDP-glycerol glycerophosphotransferase family protein, partial [Proteobacteria bacterium]|nr:CDP-glycerol glycerophosphotransferase family protein [Pseudomonadota bacterium]
RQKSLQMPFLSPGSSIVEIGFIINDQLQNNIEPATNMIKFEKKLPIVLYAPSWSTNPDMIMMNESILKALSNQDYFNVVFKPHPLLFHPDRCGGKNWNNFFAGLEKKHFVMIKESNYPIQTFMKIADVIVSDISSVIFEYLYLDRPIVLHKDEKVLEYYKGNDSFGDISKASFHFNSEIDMVDIINQALEQPDFHSELRKEILNSNYYNIGNATQAAIKMIYECLH